jgi:hypothetical protein
VRSAPCVIPASSRRLPPWARLALTFVAAVVAGCGDSRNGLPTDPDFGSAAARTVTITPSTDPVTFGPLTAPFGPPNAASKTFTITNAGPKTTTALTVSPLLAPFVITGDNCTGRSLATSGKNKSCTVTVTFTPTAIGTATATLTVLIAQPKTTLKVDLSGTGNAAPSIGGTVFTDPDVNGIKGATESGLADVTVGLFDGSTHGLLAESVTDADGKYLFSGLTTGSYRVEVGTPAGMAVTTPNAQPASIALTSAGSVLDIGLNQYNVIGRILLYVQENYNFSCGPSNPPAGGAEVILRSVVSGGGQTVVGSTTAASDGTYGFLLPSLVLQQWIVVSGLSAHAILLSPDLPTSQVRDLCIA